MVRFKVIKGSHILLAVSIVILAAVLLLMVLSSGGNSKHQAPSNLTTASAVAVYANADAYTLQVNVIPDSEPLPEKTDAPSILIYHTHTHEAYEQDASNPYEAIETWRTSDENHSVVRVGAVLAEELRKNGCNVIHDTTDHELEDINNSYVRSLETLESYNQTFDLCIDLHRDAYSEGLNLRHETDSGAKYAQVMMLVGQGNNYPEAQRPSYKSNLAFAQQITMHMNQSVPGICRNVTVKDGRYNQHIGEISVLIEVGHNLNTLEEALASIPCLAETIVNSIQ